MNVMLASGGYPWTVIPVDRRCDYMAALESASVAQDIKPFTLFLAEIVMAHSSTHPHNNITHPPKAK